MAKKSEEYSKKEIAQRFEASLRGAMKAPAKPIKEKKKVKARKKAVPK
ncbi:hypothetical protein [Afipia sp. 1NLS2]|nr:hypothetical protein [Afipia sp. 1NLS2]